MAPNRRMSTLFKLIYGSGEWIPAITSTSRSLILNYFLVTVVGLRPAIVGVILMIGRIWDAVNDPLVGLISDRLQTRWGRRRPLMLAAAVPMMVLFALLWTRPFANQWSLFAWFVVISVALDTAITVFSVPHTALVAELSSDYEERIDLSVWRNAFFILGALVIAALFKMLAEDWLGMLGGEANVFRGYMLAGWLFGVTLLVAPVLNFITVKEPANVASEVPISVMAGLRTAYRNRPFVLLSTAYFFALTGLEVVIATFVWYLQIVLRATPLLESVLPAVLLGSSLLALPLVNLLVRKLGKLKAYILCGFLWIATLPAYALYPQGAADTFLYFCVWLGFTYAAGITIPWAMLPDVLEYDELQTGNRSEGLFTAYMVFFRKLGGAVAVFVANLILARAGFIEATYGTGIEQPQSVVTALRLLSGVLPTLLVAVGVFVIRKYPITRELHRDLLAKLAERRRNAPVAPS